MTNVYLSTVQLINFGNKTMKKIKIKLKEAFYGHSAGVGGEGGPRYIHMDDDYRQGDRMTPKEDIPVDSFYGEAIPTPRARVPHPEDYSKVYAYLMGAGAGKTTGVSLEEIMKHVDAGCPESTAQALVDYLHDRARIS